MGGSTWLPKLEFICPTHSYTGQRTELHNSNDSKEERISIVESRAALGTANVSIQEVRWALYSGLNDHSVKMTTQIYPVLQGLQLYACYFRIRQLVSAAWPQAHTSKQYHLGLRYSETRRRAFLAHSCKRCDEIRSLSL
jgi:hypothetical protein